SDVCSSDLHRPGGAAQGAQQGKRKVGRQAHHACLPDEGQRRRAAEISRVQRLARRERREPDAEEVLPHRLRRRHAQRAGGPGGARLRPQGRAGDRAGNRRTRRQGARGQARPGADERRVLLDQFARRHRRHVVHADRQRAGSGHPRRVALVDEAGLERQGIRAAPGPAAVAVLRPPRDRRRSRGAFHRVPRAAARRPAARAAVGRPMRAMAAALAPGDAGDRLREVAGRGWSDVGALLDLPLLHSSGLDVTVGGLIAAVLAIALTWLVSVFVRRALHRFGSRHQGVNQAAVYALSRVIHYILLLVGILLALDFAGVSLGKFALFASAVGVGLGFGLQAIFGNFIAGLVLLFDRSLKVGDFVELDADTRGTVHAINIRATRIITNDNIGVLVPNAEFVNGRVVNWTHRSVNRRIRVPFRVPFGVDKELVKKAALEAAARVPFTLATEGEQRPQVWLVNYGENGVDFLLVVWLTGAAARRNVAIQAAYLW